MHARRVLEARVAGRLAASARERCVGSARAVLGRLALRDDGPAQKARAATGRVEQRRLL